MDAKIQAQDKRYIFVLRPAITGYDIRIPRMVLIVSHTDRVEHSDFIAKFFILQ